MIERRITNRRIGVLRRIKLPNRTKKLERLISGVLALIYLIIAYNYVY